MNPKRIRDIYFTCDRVHDQPDGSIAVLTQPEYTRHIEVETGPKGPRQQMRPKTKGLLNPDLTPKDGFKAKSERTSERICARIDKAAADLEAKRERRRRERRAKFAKLRSK